MGHAYTAIGTCKDILYSNIYLNLLISISIPPKDLKGHTVYGIMSSSAVPPTPNPRLATYLTPIRTDMAVLMVMFNPMSSIRIVQNWLYVWNKLQAVGIPVFGTELLFPWQKPFLADTAKTLTVRSESIMFHKEKLLERLEREVPTKYTKLCCIDCDVIFRRPDWYDAVSAALDSIPIVQPYSECHWMGPDLRTAVMRNPSAAVNLADIRKAHAGGKTDRLYGHPGFAVAMRRGEIRQFPWAVVGGGDAVLFRAVNGLVGEFANSRMRQLMAGAWADYAVSMPVDGSISVVEGEIWHMWHGPLQSRQYYDRYAKFVEAVPATVMDIRELLVENADGVWEWRSDVRKSVNSMMLRYFGSRDDDGIA